jgi:hypothetical protein
VKRVSRCVVLLLLTACAACGSSSSGGTPTAGGAASASTQAPSAAAAAEPAAADGNPVDGAAFCALLAKVAPKLKGDGSAAGALADLTVELSNWIEAHPEQKPRTAADLDAASTSCSPTRSAVLASLGTASFAKAFGG